MVSAAAPCEQHAKLLSKDCLIYSNNPQFCNQKCCEFRCLSSPYNEQTFGWQIPNIHVSTNPQQWAAANVSHRCLLRPISRFLPIHGQNMFKDWQLSPKITSSSSSSFVHSLSWFQPLKIMEKKLHSAFLTSTDLHGCFTVHWKSHI